MPSMLKGHPASVSTSSPKKSLEENANSNQYAISDIREGLRTGGINSNGDDLGTKLPDDSNTLFDVPSFQHPSELTVSYQNSEMYIKVSGHANYLEELTLYYLDPQGGM
jgi:PERQ amino acid-rich with GYF domain-containing protein